MYMNNRYRKDVPLMDLQRYCSKLFFMRQYIAQEYTMNTFHNYESWDLRNESFCLFHTLMH